MKLYEQPLIIIYNIANIDCIRTSNGDSTYEENELPFVPFYEN